MLVDLNPSRMPLHWLWGKLTQRQELITFQADLDCAPPFSLHVHNFRWFARGSRKNLSSTNGWTLEQTGPFIITTRMEWRKEVTSAMSSLVGAGSRDFVDISFNRHSPHFSVSMPLAAISPTCPTHACVFEAVREVATSSLPSLF
jgi:hypothetical protein